MGISFNKDFSFFSIGVTLKLFYLCSLGYFLIDKQSALSLQCY